MKTKYYKITHNESTGITFLKKENNKYYDYTPEDCIYYWEKIGYNNITDIRKFEYIPGCVFQVISDIEILLYDLDRIPNEK